MLAERAGCCEVMPVGTRGRLGAGRDCVEEVSPVFVGRVPPAAGPETSCSADSRAALFRAIPSRSIAPTTLRPSGREAEATPRSVFFEPTTSVRSEVLENVACQLATALSLSPSNKYMSGATPASGFQSL